MVNVERRPGHEESTIRRSICQRQRRILDATRPWSIIVGMYILRRNMLVVWWLGPWVAVEAFAVSTSIESMQQSGVCRERWRHSTRLAATTVNATSRAAAERAPQRADTARNDRSRSLTAPSFSSTASKRQNEKTHLTFSSRGSASIRTLVEEAQHRQSATNNGNATVIPLTQAYCDFLLAECVSHDEWDLLLSVLALMASSHRPVGHGTYTACLEACFSTANAATAHDVWSALKMAGLVPRASDVTWTILATCRHSSHAWRPALQLLDEYSTRHNPTGDDGLPLGVYDAILTCMVPDRQWKDAIRLLRRLEAHPTTPPAVSTYRTVLECCVGQAEQAVPVLYACARRMTPTRYAFELVLRALTHKLQWRRAVPLLDLMEEVSVPRTVHLYNLVLAACAKAREAVPAKQLLRRMQQRDGIAPNIASYNSVLSACASAGQWRDALVVLDVAQRQPGITPDIYTYTNAIRACAKGGKTERALSLFQVVKDRGLPLDSYCYTAVIEACDWKQALKLLNEMEEKGIEVSEVAYSVTIKACGDSGQWRTALDLVETMRNKTIPVNLYVYNAAITAVAKAAKQKSRGNDGESNLWTHVLALLEQMRRDGIAPDGFSFSSAISCCGSEGRWEEALDLIDGMLQGGPKTRPNKIAYTAAISSCGRAGKVEHALRLFRQMKEQGLSADRVAYNALFAALRVSKKSEAAFELWDEMLGKPSKQDATSRVAMARGLTSPDIITLTDAIGAMSSGSDQPAIRERIDRVFADAVRLGAVFRGDRQTSPLQFDLTSMSFPVARAACRFVLHGVKARYSELGSTPGLLFATGTGNHRQNGTMSLKEYVQEVLRDDFNPSIDSTVSSATQGSLIITAESLSSWMKT